MVGMTVTGEDVGGSTTVADGAGVGVTNREAMRFVIPQPTSRIKTGNNIFK
jgi:hypothetical protein